VLKKPDDAPELPALDGREEAERWLEENIDAALACSEQAAEHGEHGLVMRFAEACESRLREKGRYTDAVALMERGIGAAAAAGAPDAEARIRNQYGLILLELHSAGGAARSIEQFTEALRLAERAGDDRGRAAALECLGIAEQRRGEDEKALEYFDRARPFKEAMRRPQAMAILALLAARSLVDLGRFAEALDRLGPAFEVFHDPEQGNGPDPVNEAKVLLERGRALHGLGRTAEAGAALAEARDAFADQGVRFWHARALEALADLERPRSAQDAERLLAEAAALYRGIGNLAEAERLESKAAGN